MGTEETEKLQQQLKQFGQTQFGTRKPAEIAGTTAHLIMSVAFFTGATIQLASMRGMKKADYLPALQDYLSETFKLPAKNAAGLIESNARLFKRYKLIDSIYKKGWQTAQAWSNKEAVNAQLDALLQKHKDLNMSALNVEGIKEEKVAPVEVEEIIPTPEPVVVERPGFPWGRVLWLIVLLGGAAAAYVWREEILQLASPYLGL